MLIKKTRCGRNSSIFKFYDIYGIVSLLLLIVGADFIASGLLRSEGCRCFVTISNGRSHWICSFCSVRVATSAFNAVDHAFRSTPLFITVIIYRYHPLGWLSISWITGCLLRVSCCSLCFFVIWYSLAERIIKPRTELKPDNLYVKEPLKFQIQTSIFISSFFR